LVFESTKIALESRFADNWTHTSIKWSNILLNTKSLDEWVCINFVPDKSKIAQIGTNVSVYRYFGVIVVQIFVKPNIGLFRAKVLSDYVADIWRTAQFSRITVDVPEIVDVGILNGWYQLNVQNQYFVDDYSARSPLILSGFSLGFSNGFK
jgi:hypothetical protein